jgi:DNA-binding MarR family transcriptional regulator
MSTKELSKKELLEQLYDLGHASSNATIQYHQAAAEVFGLNATDMKTIPLLTQRESISAGDLADILGLTTGAITSVIDRLEKIGLVERIVDPTDRRKVLVCIRPEGLAKIYGAYQPMGDAMQALHEQYDAQQLEIIIGFLEKSNAIMMREGLELRKLKR